jgi:2-oxoglutarate dehydrogenase E2 component (dihydrolipoamide succinyltransferase)
MAQVELIMPKMGESITEATVLAWLKKPGDKIELEESVLEVATDKVDTEIPSTHAGILKDILVQKGQIVQVGAPIAVLTVDAEAVNENSTEVSPNTTERIPQPLRQRKELASAHSNGKDFATDFKSSSKFFSPLVKNIAKEEKITVEELETIEGSGAAGRITKKDILDYVQHRKLGETVKGSEKSVNLSSSTVSVSIGAEDEIIEMDRMRKMIAERMVESKRITPHVTSFVEADVTSIIYWRNKVKHDFQKRTGDALTYTPFFIEAVVNAIKDYPMINIQVDGDKIIKKKEINIGMAVALPSGNLIVPVIKNADQYSLAGLARVVNDVAKRARDNKLKPDELSGGTFTISNVGSFGNVMGTPIIVQPQVAIIALGTIQKKPSVMETPYGDVIAIRHKMFLSHSYDHRVIDGALGGSMVRRVADYLEKFDTTRSL